MSGNLPVFVFPLTLNFYVSDISSQKQILTLYNPYDFPLSYRVLCTAPRKYSVVDPEGTLRSKCCIDVVIRHLAARSSNVGQTDRFRIKIQEHGQKECLGSKDVIATLEHSPASSCAEEQTSESMFEGISARATTSSDSSRQYTFPQLKRGADQDVEHRRNPTMVVVLVGLCCVVILSLPTVGDSASSLNYPPYLYLTVPQKLVASYVLGLITMLLLRP